MVAIFLCLMFLSRSCSCLFSFHRPLSFPDVNNVLIHDIMRIIWLRLICVWLFFGASRTSDRIAKPCSVQSFACSNDHLSWFLVDTSWVVCFFTFRRLIRTMRGRLKKKKMICWWNWRKTITHGVELVRNSIWDWGNYARRRRDSWSCQRNTSLRLNWQIMTKRKKLTSNIEIEIRKKEESDESRQHWTHWGRRGTEGTVSRSRSEASKPKPLTDLVRKPKENRSQYLSR